MFLFVSLAIRVPPRVPVCVQVEELERRREQQLYRFVVLLQKLLRGWYLKRQYAKLRKTVPYLQSVIRASLSKYAFGFLRQATRKLQSGVPRLSALTRLVLTGCC